MLYLTYILVRFFFSIFFQFFFEKKKNLLNNFKELLIKGGSFLKGIVLMVLW